MVIGITGGVGSGKSTVLEILKNEYGARLIMTDDVARELMEPGMPVYNAVVAEFGPEIIEGGQNGMPIDRKALAAIVFADSEKLEKLNSLSHPQVRTETERRIDEYYKEDPEALIIIEAALLIEAGYRDILDELWSVIADPEIRIMRLAQSRGYSREKSESIMASQMSNEEYIEKTDFSINNSGSVDETRKQIADRLNGWISYSNERTDNRRKICRRKAR